jgi:type IX secretion system PorP/SprF family membrane protein
LKKIVLHITFLVILTLSFTAWGQRDPQLSQQYFSRLNINPAATDVSNYANAFLIARQQWIGFEGAPSTQMFNAHGYVSDIRSSIGLSVLNDIVGNNRFLNMMLNYGYHMKVGEESYFALGLGAGVVTRSFGGDLITDVPETDPDIIRMLAGQSIFRPDINLGLTYWSPNFSFGLSATHLARYAMKDDDWFKPPLHIYAFLDAGFNINETTRFTLRPQLLSSIGSVNTIKIAEDTIQTINIMERMDILLDLAAIVSMVDKFWIGGSFRVSSFSPFGGASFAAIVGFNITPDLRIGYSYDHKIGNSFQNIKTYGSHEIMLNYRMKIAEPQTAEKTPRFFD